MAKKQKSHATRAQLPKIVKIDPWEGIRKLTLSCPDLNELSVKPGNLRIDSMMRKQEDIKMSAVKYAVSNKIIDCKW